MNIGSTIEKIYKTELLVPQALASYSDKINPFFVRNFIRDEGTYSVFSIPNQSPLFQNEKATIKTCDFTTKRQNFDQSIQSTFKIKLFYTSGVEEISLDIREAFTEDDLELCRESFRNNRL